MVGHENKWPPRGKVAAADHFEIMRPAKIPSKQSPCSSLHEAAEEAAFAVEAPVSLRKGQSVVGGRMIVPGLQDGGAQGVRARARSAVG